MYRKILAPFFICLTLSAFWGCQKDAHEDETQEPLVYASNVECGKSKTQICNEGLAFAHIGDSLPAVKADGWDVASMKDTVYDSEEYQGYAKIFHFQKGGFVILESKPFEKETETPEYNLSHVNVIRIHSPLFETPEHLKVGGTFADLNRVYPDSLIEVQPGTEDGTLELKIPKVSRMNFVISQEDVKQDAPGTEVLSTESIPDAAKIISILIKP